MSAPDPFPAERTLASELIACWLIHGPSSDEFGSLVAHAATEFDAETVISTLTAITCVLIEFAGSHLGGTPAVRSIIQDNFSPQEAHQ